MIDLEHGLAPFREGGRVMLLKPTLNCSFGIVTRLTLVFPLIGTAVLAQVIAGSQMPQMPDTGQLTLASQEVSQLVKYPYQPLVGPPGTALFQTTSRTSPISSNKTNFAGGITYDSGGMAPLSLVVADVNMDGTPDLVVTDSSQVGVLLGNGDGTFQTPLIYDAGGTTGCCGASAAVAVADLNRDGKPDLVVVASVWPLNTFRVLLGNGDGTFQPVSVYDSFGGNSVVVADVNGDLIPDLVIANSYPDSVGVLLGNGDGTFGDPVSYDPGGVYTDGVAVGDVNGDGKPDLVVSNAAGTLGVLLGNGNGTFQPVRSLQTGGSYLPETYSPAIVDVNGDRKPDLVAANWASGSIGVLLGNGDGTFQPAVTYSCSGTPYSIAVADVNQDGSLDLLAANSYGVTVDVLLGNGDGTFKPAVTYDTGRFGLGSQSSHALAAADLNRDGKVDLAVAVPSPPGVSVLLNNTGAPPAATTLTSNPNPVPTGHSVTYTAVVQGPLGQGVSGWMKFRDGTSTIAAVPLTNNQAAYRTTYTKGGTHSITATYSGDLHNARSTSASLIEYISSIPTKMLVSTSGSPSLINQLVTFSAFVASTQGPIPDGELVTFSDGTTTMGSVALAGGTASFTTTSLSPRSHTIKAAYVGDASFKPSAGRVSQVVDKYPATTTLKSNLNPSLYGQNVTFTAKVTATGSAPPTGNVAFRWNSYSIGIAPLGSSGVATLTRSQLNAAAYPLTAVYLGDSVNAKSTSDVVNQLVEQTTSRASIISSQNPSSAGQAVTFVATITSPTVLPSGPVTFKAGTTILGTGQLSHGKAQMTISSLPVGLTKVTAIYDGDSNIARSAASVTQTVQPR